MVETQDVAPEPGIEPQLGLLLAVLEDGTKEWREELGDMDEEGLAWRPFSDGPSVGAELLHIAEVEAWWIQEIVGGQALSGEFLRRTLANVTDQYAGLWGEAPRTPLADYFALLDEVRERTREVIRNETQPDRALKPRPDKPGLTVRWALGHVIQHEAYHGGQAVLIKRMQRGKMW